MKFSIAVLLCNLAIVGCSPQKSLNKSSVRRIFHQAQNGLLEFSPDDRLLATASNNTIVLLDASQGSQQWILGNHLHPIRCMKFSPDGQTVASVGWGERAILLWNVRDRRLVRTLEGHDKPVRSIAFSSNGRFIASGSDEDFMVILWDAETGHKLKTLVRKDLPVTSANIQFIAFSPDNGLLAAGVDSVQGYSSVVFWSLPFGTEGARISLTAQPKRHVFLRNARILVLGDYRGVLHFINLDSFKVERILAAHDNLYALAVSPDQSLIATLAGGSGPGSSELKLWDAAELTQRASLSGQYGCLISLAWSADGETLATGASDGTIVLWDVNGILEKEK